MAALPPSRTVDSSPTAPHDYQVVSYTWNSEPESSTSSNTVTFYADSTGTTVEPELELRLPPPRPPVWDMMPLAPHVEPLRRGRGPMDARPAIWACRPRHGLSGG